MYVTRKLKLGHSPKLDGLAELSGDLWTKACRCFWRTVDRQGIWLKKNDLQRWVCNGVEGMSSHSAQAVTDQFYEALNSWRANREDNPSRKPPYKPKRYNCISWKYPVIKVVEKEGERWLRLSCGAGAERLWIPEWDYPEPKRVQIVWDGEQYVLCAQYQVEPSEAPKGDEVAGVDLGEIHIASVSTGDGNPILVNGRELRAKRQYQNRIKARLQSKIDRKEHGSRRWLKIVRSKNKQLSKIRNQIRDLLHKMSTRMVETLQERRVSTIVVGDLRGIRQRIDFGAKQNQRLHQWCHRRFLDMLSHKAEMRGMVVERINEAYTTQECPKCRNRHKPSGRNYSCPECGFKWHRDAVGAHNIRTKYLRESSSEPTSVIGDTAPPIGVRYKPHMRCSSPSRSEPPVASALKREMVETKVSE